MTDALIRQFTRVSTSMVGGFTTDMSGAARLLIDEVQGFAMDATTMGGTVVVKDVGTPANNLNNVALSNSNLTQLGTSAKYVQWNDSKLRVIPAGAVAQEYDVDRALFGMRAEPGATNLVLQSETFDNAFWGKNNCSITANTIIAPDGVITADTFKEDALAAFHYLASSGITIGAGSTNTLGVFAKVATGTRTFAVNISDPAGIDQVEALFDLTNGTVTAANNIAGGSGATGAIASVGDGWYRCSVTGIVSTDTSVLAIFGLTNSSSTFNSYTGDGASSFYVWGAQFEHSPNITSYIPTTSAPVIRDADVVQVLLSTVPFSATAGSLYLDMKAAGTAGRDSVVLTDGTDQEDIDIYHSGATWFYYVVDGGVQQLNHSDGVFTALVREQVSAAWALNDFDFSANGGALISDTGTVPTVTKLIFNLNATGFVPPHGLVYRLVYVPRQVQTSSGNLATWRYNF